MSDSEIGITVNGVSHSVLCGTCNQPISFVGKPDTEEGQAGCVACANIADVNEVAKIALAYAKHEAQLILNRSAKAMARESKIVTFSGKTEQDVKYRFVVDLKIDDI
ncbi:hypothetical protein [Sedimentitalea todarodis]|uniref:Uncharacterized protein n=1 Tax=Sedimentitalea todarodis TaxID=1631240 RepID=A0ABU3VHW1_9RHOB|nr:hypothetical protein [Sedimentitalea todarodis]MDU9005739.1 hypothetical protein [Sedimentitalea todarodis]